MRARRNLCVIGALVLFVPTTLSAAPVEDVELWAVQSLGVAVSKHLTVIAEVQEREVDDIHRLGTTIVRGLVAYRLNDRLTLAIGATHNATKRRQGTSFENNVFEQILWNVRKIGLVKVRSRTWIEERRVDGKRDTGVRLRERLRFELPLGKRKPTLFAATEPMLNVNSTDWGASAGFDQIRNSIGVSVTVAKGVTIETGYMNRYQRRANTPDRIDHIIPLSLAIRL